MALFAGSLYAESLGMNTGVTVSLPGERRDRTGDMPVLYLLHGLSDDHTSWVRRTDIDRYAEEWGVAVTVSYTHVDVYKRQGVQRHCGCYRCLHRHYQPGESFPDLWLRCV